MPSPLPVNGDAKGEALAVEERVVLPVLSPVAGQGLPRRRPLRLHGHRVHVGDEGQVEVRVDVDGELDAALLLARHPAQVEPRHGQCHLYSLRAEKILERRGRTYSRRQGQCWPCRARCVGRRAGTCRGGPESLFLPESASSGASSRRHGLRVGRSL